ncbi:MAG: AAA family ATPase, partial [Lachnospiraceae bacterium]|nr:AAA family ATPase [Lachnospiraceae bacterium]
IMTSNIGAQYLLDGIDENGEMSPEAEEEVMEQLKGSFRPEFLNRLDEIIMFKPLSADNIKSITKLLILSLNKRLKDRELTIAVTDDALSFIAENGYEPVYGARPLKRYIQKYVETGVAKLILSDSVKMGDTIEIGVENGELNCRAISG